MDNKKLFDYVKNNIVHLNNNDIDSNIIIDSDIITIIITTNPIISNPSICIFEKLIDSIKKYDIIKNSKIIISFDGCLDFHNKKNYELFKKNYELFKKNIDDYILNNNLSHNISTIYADKHVHQSNTIKNAVKMITTKFAFIIEHDFEIIHDINFYSILKTMILYEKYIKCVRLSLLEHIYHNNNIRSDIFYPDSIVINNINFIPVINWSSHPFILNMTYYKKKIMKYIHEDSRTYIEEVFNGIIHTNISEDHSKFFKYGMYIYAEPIENFIHLKHNDGRGNMKKILPIFKYGNKIPKYAPAEFDTYPENIKKEVLDTYK
jgi:hypothetical protein